MTTVRWRAEQTAPFNTPVLVYAKPHIAVGIKTQWPSKSSWSIAESFGFNEDGEIVDVTHWSPLPSAPGGTNVYPK